MVKRRATTRKVTFTKSFETPTSLAMETPMEALTAGSVTNPAGLLTFIPSEPLITMRGFGVVGAAVEEEVYVVGAVAVLVDVLFAATVVVGAVVLAAKERAVPSSITSLIDTSSWT
mmetsp:Transcript_85381/g.239092  ORF Transcript_85381/g.239092 Transcript_85381/m.239092 type:complete len:116 (+) Transcript_85381:114-461(+)